ncbi:MAG: hypothetical protein PETM_00667 [Petrimonas sp.]|uniref:DUF2851 family protein n=1 Tax=Petrimonas sp. TaxID=2023866 RepID=UPI0030D2CD92
MTNNEYLLHYVWKYRLFDRADLQTMDGQKVDIIDPGTHNTDAGADFFNAKIKIGDKMWAGDVEIHPSSGDWTKHGHHTDESYNSVILHVAERVKGVVRNQKGVQVPQMQLIVPEDVRKNAAYLLNSKSSIPCKNHLPLVERRVICAWMVEMGGQRLERKINDIFTHMARFNNSWDHSFYVLLVRNFGFGLNSDGFERLALSLPLNCIQRHSDSLFQIEALLYGQAGLLYDDIVSDDYYLQLRKEYGFLKHKYQLKPIDGFLFKKLRVRPRAFPQVRIAQLATLLKQSDRLFSSILEREDYRQLWSYFQVDTSDYWHTHYSFGKESERSRKYLGESSFHVILINTVVPMLFAYGRKTGQEKFCDRALQILETVEPERNAIVAEFAVSGISPVSAFDSQALIQLKKEYCDKRKCLYCKIGNQILAR